MFNPEFESHAYEEHPPGRDLENTDKKNTPADGTEVTDNKNPEKTSDQRTEDQKKSNDFQSNLHKAEGADAQKNPPPNFDNPKDLALAFGDVPPKAPKESSGVQAQGVEGAQSESVNA